MPRVTIGVPVYNGARFLAEALESILGQTFGDLEIIVSDNASTDGTEDIARSFARRDGRVRYDRLAANVGAAENFNIVARRARGDLFKWHAHDDLLAPTFVARAVEALERDPGVVLAYACVTYIDELGREIGSWSSRLPTEAADPSVRYAALLDPHECLEVFGLMRRSALAATPMMGGYAHGDGVLLARLALVGRFHEVPEPLFLSRRHAEQSGTRFYGDPHRFAAWFDPRVAGRTLFPWWRIHSEWLRSIALSPIPAAEKARCLWRFGRVLGWNRSHLANDVRHHLRRVTSGEDTPSGGAPRHDLSVCYICACPSMKGRFDVACRSTLLHITRSGRPARG